MGTEIDRHLTVSDEQFEYLRSQKGSLFDLSQDRVRWLAAYEADLWKTYCEIREYLPSPCWGVLDIGSGLGGIDALLTRHFADNPPYIHLLDGEQDSPRMRRHRQTFNNMRVAKEFLRDNGVRPDRFGYFTCGAENLPRPYDLVLSLGSWCFHYPPDVYLPLLLAGGGLHRDSVLIMDVRNEKPEYEQQLEQALTRVAVIRNSKKFTRAVYRRKV